VIIFLSKRKQRGKNRGSSVDAGENAEAGLEASEKARAELVGDISKSTSRKQELEGSGEHTAELSGRSSIHELQ
jgi:hypothetical protein